MPQNAEPTQLAQQGKTELAPGALAGILKYLNPQVVARTDIAL